MLLEEIKKDIIYIIESSFKKSNYFTHTSTGSGVINTLSYYGFQNIENIQVGFIDDKNKKYGDIFTNVALVLYSDNFVNANPDFDNMLDIAKVIKSKLETNNNYEKIEIAQNNFINITLSEEYLKNKIKSLQDNDYKYKLENSKYTGKNIFIEHTSPNLFKPFHIGHLMNNIIGNSLFNLLKSTGANIYAISFPSDVSLGIAKAIYIIKRDLDEYVQNGGSIISFFFQDKFRLENGEQNIKKIMEYFGEAYSKGTKFYEENIDKQSEIKNISNAIYINFLHNESLIDQSVDDEYLKLYSECKSYNIDYFIEISHSLGSRFEDNNIIYESVAGYRGKLIVGENMNIFEKSDGAIVYDTGIKKNKQSEETIKSVFINSEGHPTYEAKDLGLLELKGMRYNVFGDKQLDYSMIITDNEQIPHFEVVLDVAKKINNLKHIAEHTINIPHGRMTLKGEKMSSRLGNVLLAEDIIDMATRKTEEKMKDKEKIDEEDKRKIAIAAIKIAILKSKPGLNIDFDPDVSINVIGDTGPYLLYTLVRAKSIFEKSRDHDIKIINKIPDDYLLNINQRLLLVKLLEYNDILQKAVNELSPQIIVKYLFELARAFNSFLEKEKIIDMDNKINTEINLYIASIFLSVLKISLNSIGIEEVEKM